MKIRIMEKADLTAIINMMRGFYASDAVLTNGSEEIFLADAVECVSDSPYLEGYVFEESSEVIGYGMLAKSYSTEFGKGCIWIEDIFIKEGYRGLGIGSDFIRMVEKKYPNHILRLEVEGENESAVSVYKKNGFDFLPYLEMKK